MPNPKPPADTIPWYRATLGYGLLGSLLMFVALPPLDLWPLAWIAPLPWLLLVRRERLIGKWAYPLLWVCGFVFWLLAAHWLRKPHWSTYFGWLALAMYLAFYLPAFIAITRVAVHRLRVPLLLAAPIVWTGLELARAHLITGFLMAALGHTQIRWIALLQISDLVGSYGVCFVVMFVAGCLAQTWPSSGWRPLLWPLVPASALLAAVLAYGHWQLHHRQLRPGPVIALLHGQEEAVLSVDPGKRTRTIKRYFDILRQAVDAPEKPELIVWPESMFPQTAITFDETVPNDAETKPARDAQRDLSTDLASLSRNVNAALMLGTYGRHYYDATGYRKFNSAVCVARDGQWLGRYDKTHLVLFGEYTPLIDSAAWLRRFAPLTGSCSAGEQPRVFAVNGVRYSPNICYETVLPHVIRGQVDTLRQAGTPPDVLVNLTNDGWFRGSSELEMHLACDIFRAVETRTPLVIAANGGISGSIDSLGRIVTSARGGEKAIITQVSLDVTGAESPTADRPASLYVRTGDLFAGTCLGISILLATFGIYRWRKEIAIR